MMQEMLTMYKEGKLNDAQADWFKPSKPQEELYDVVNDPDEIHNLAADSTYHDKLVAQGFPHMDKRGRRHGLYS